MSATTSRFARANRFFLLTYGYGVFALLIPLIPPFRFDDISVIGHALFKLYYSSPILNDTSLLMFVAVPTVIFIRGVLHRERIALDFFISLQYLALFTLWLVMGVGSFSAVNLEVSSQGTVMPVGRFQGLDHVG